MKHDNNDAGPEALPTIADNEIVTKRKVARRSFLGASGALLMAAGGIAAAHTAPQDDPNKRPDDKPRAEDKPKPEDREKAEARRKREEREREEQRRKSQDPDKPGDPHN